MCLQNLKPQPHQVNFFGYSFITVSFLIFLLSSVILSIYLSFFLSDHLSIHLSVYLSLSLANSPFIFSLFLSLHLSFSLYLFLSFSLSLTLSIHLFFLSVKLHALHLFPCSNFTFWSPDRRIWPRVGATRTNWLCSLKRRPLVWHRALCVAWWELQVGPPRLLHWAEPAIRWLCCADPGAGLLWIYQQLLDLPAPDLDHWIQRQRLPKECQLPLHHRRTLHSATPISLCSRDSRLSIENGERG